MAIPTDVYVSDRRAWRNWLKQHYARPKGLWLIYDKTDKGTRHLTYDAIVEEALCYGWIDSKTGSVDSKKAKIWVSPRNPKSAWSKSNKLRVEKLTKAGLMMPPGMAAIEAAKQNGAWNILDDVEELVIPDDLAKAFAKNKLAKTNYETFPRFARKQILYRIAMSKRPETRAQRIAKTIEHCAQNLRQAG